MILKNHLRQPYRRLWSVHVQVLSGYAKQKTGNNKDKWMHCAQGGYGMYPWHIDA